MTPSRYRIARAWPEMAGVASMALEPVDAPLAPFRPGQFNMLGVFGVGEVPVSVSGDPDAAEILHTTRAVGAVTAALTRMAPGDMLGLRGPFGSAWPVDSETGRHILIVAGGLGLAPLRPAILHVLARRAAYAGLSIVYGARGPDMLLYADDLHRWKARFDTEMEITVDHAAPGWTGRVGMVTGCLDRVLAGVDPATVSAFLCGPEIMMRFVTDRLAAAGLSPDRIWLSMERNMKCAVGICGHCQMGPHFICRDGPVLRQDRLAGLLTTPEI